MEILSKPELFYRLEASVSDAEASNGNRGFIEAGQTLAC